MNLLKRTNTKGHSIAAGKNTLCYEKGSVNNCDVHTYVHFCIFVHFSFTVINYGIFSHPPSLFRSTNVVSLHIVESRYEL